MPRVVLTDEESIGDVTLSRNDLVVVSVEACQRGDVDVWGHDADEWRPSRFSDVDAEQERRMTERIMAFGSGPRRCPGRMYALRALDSMLERLARRVTLTTTQSPAQWPRDEHVVAAPRPLKVEATVTKVHA